MKGSVGEEEQMGDLELVHSLIQSAALFVQNLAENHSIEVKHFLRIQDQAIANVNLVAQVAQLTIKMCE